MTSEANGIKNEQFKAYFLTNIGEELLDVYRSKRKDEKIIYADDRNILVEHTKPKTVVFTERAIFRRARRLEGESANDYATRLRTLAWTAGMMKPRRRQLTTSGMVQEAQTRHIETIHQSTYQAPQASSMDSIAVGTAVGDQSTNHAVSIKKRTT